MSTKKQILEARFAGRHQRLRGVIWADKDPERAARHRAEWPRLWEAIDHLIELIDEDSPPFGRPGEPTFGPPR